MTENLRPQQLAGSAKTAMAVPHTALLSRHSTHALYEAVCSCSMRLAGRHTSTTCLTQSMTSLNLRQSCRRNLHARFISHATRGFTDTATRSKHDKDTCAVLHYELPLKIVKYPDPRLRAKNKRISSFDERLQVLVREMFDIMYRTDGVGLSAPQVGVNVQLMVFNPAGEQGKGEEIVLVNPEIYKYSRKTKLFEEGCLSFPKIYGDVERPISVKIKAWDIDGKKFILNLKEFHARIFQHEYDHLQGILFFERMRPDVLDSIRPALQELEQKYEIQTGVPAPERV